jgi:hypothetical protein
MPAPSKYWANVDNIRVYFPVVFAANPRCVCTNSKYGVRIGGKPGRGQRRRANTPAKLPSFVCFEEDPDRGAKNKNTGAAGVSIVP